MLRSDEFPLGVIDKYRLVWNLSTTRLERIMDLVLAEASSLSEMDGD